MLRFARSMRRSVCLSLAAGLLAFAASLPAADSDYAALGDLLSSLESKPATANPATRSRLKEVSKPEAIERTVVHDQPTVVAANPRDAINAVVNERPAAGVSMIRFPSGFGWVATGIGSYAAYPNPTASRISKRNAYVAAYNQAKIELTRTLTGMNTAAKDELLESMSVLVTEDDTMVNMAAERSEQITQAVQAVLRGFVVYEVEDRQDQSVVSVSIVTTPKTRAFVNRSGGGFIDAATLEQGLGSIMTDIKAGVVPPIGARLIKMRGTDRMAMVGFGSDVIRIHKLPQVQTRLNLTAVEAAKKRAQDALIGVIIGDDTKWRSSLSEENSEILQEFDQANPADPRSAQRIADARVQFTNKQETASVIEAARGGSLPAGVQLRSWTDEVSGVAYALAIYLPPATIVENKPTAQPQPQPGIPPTRNDDQGAVQPTEQPDWITTRPTDPAFLWGIGEVVATAQNARDRSTAKAHLDIVKQLFVTVSGEQSVREAMTIITDEESDSVEIAQMVTDDVRIAVPSTSLMGVETVDQQLRNGVQYTLVRISRPDLSAIMQGRLIEIDQQLQTVLPAPARLEMNYVRRLLPLMGLVQERAGVVLMLRALSVEPAASPLSPAFLRTHLGRLANGGTVRLQGGNKAPATRDTVLDVIDLMGLTVLQKPDAAFEFRLRESERTREIDGWHRVTLTSAITIVDMGSGEVIGSAEHAVEKSSTQGKAESLARARDAMIEEFGPIAETKLLEIMLGIRER